MVDYTFPFTSSSFSGIQWNLLILVEINKHTLNVSPICCERIVHLPQTGCSILFLLLHTTDKKLQAVAATLMWEMQGHYEYWPSFQFPAQWGLQTAASLRPFHRIQWHSSTCLQLGSWSRLACAVGLNQEQKWSTTYVVRTTVCQMNQLIIRDVAAKG